MVLQICSLIALRRAKERLYEVRGKAEGVVRHTAHPPNSTLCLHAYEHAHIDTLGYTRRAAC